MNLKDPMMIEKESVGVRGPSPTTPSLWVEPSVLYNKWAHQNQKLGTESKMFNPFPQPGLAANINTSGWSDMSMIVLEILKTFDQKGIMKGH